MYCPETISISYVFFLSHLLEKMSGMFLSHFLYIYKNGRKERCFRQFENKDKEEDA
jgi:hypothetical protein